MKLKINDKPVLVSLVLWFSFISLSIIVKPSVLLVVLSGLVFFIFRKKICFHDSDVFIYVLSLLISFGCYILASVKFSGYSIIHKVASYFGLPFETLSSSVYIIVALATIPFVYVATRFVIKDLLGFEPSILKSEKTWVRAWLILSAVYCFAIITIVRSNFVYKDDMQRIVTGRTVYTRESRTLAEYILGLLETNTFFGDISPLTQVLEMSLMALSAVILFRVFSEKKNAGFWDFIGMISFGIFPYFMEPISFKYDSPQHGLAVFLAVLPLLYYKKDLIKYTILTAVCVILSCSSHQVPMTVFPMAVIMLCIVNSNTGRQDFVSLKKFIISSVCGYVTGLVFYKAFIMKPIGYNTSLSTVNSLKNLIPGMIENYSEFFSCIYNDYNKFWLIVTALVFICFFVNIMKKTVLKKSFCLIITTLGLLLMLALSNSLYPLLEDPLHYPRHLYSFGLFTGMIVIAAVSYGSQKAIITKTSSLILSMCYISFAMIYGNALYYQKNYTSARVQMVIQDLNEYPEFQEKSNVQVQILGSTGFAPAVYYHAEHYPLLKELIPTSFNAYHGDWAATDLYNLYGLNAFYDPDSDIDLSTVDLPKIKDTYYYNIYSDGSRFAVELKERSNVVWLE